MNRRFTYRAVEPTGREREGSLEAPDLGAAAEDLRRRMLHPTRLQAEREPPAAPPVADAFVLFNESLAALTRLSVPLPPAMRELSGQLRGSRLREPLQRVEARLREGRTLDEAVEAEGAVFPPHYAALVRAGAAAGNLPAVLAAVAFDTARVRRLERAVARALSYPLFVLLMAAAVGAAYLAWYVPAIRTLYDAASIMLPALLQSTLLMESLLWSPVSVLLASAVGLMVVRVLARTRPDAERFLFRIPVFGRTTRRLVEARFLTALRLLIGAGVPLSSAGPLALRAAGSPGLDAAIPSVETALRDGRPLGEALSTSLAPAVARYLLWGEQSGRLAESLGDLRAMALEEAEELARTIETVAEPAATLLAGAALGTMIVPMAMPYFTLLQRLTAL